MSHPAHAELDARIKAQIELVKAAHGRQAVGEQFAADYLTFRGGCYYYPTVAHQWLFARLNHIAFPSAAARDVVLVYALGCTAEEVRNRLVGEVELDIAAEQAELWRIGAGLNDAEVAHLLKRLLPPPSRSSRGGQLQPCWWARIVVRIAGATGWTEHDILSLPWRRAAAYLDCIAEDNGHTVIRELEMTPEEELLQELMQLRYGAPKES